MNIKHTLLAAFGLILMATLQPAVMANPNEHSDEKQFHAEKMQEHVKHMLDKLAGRLEIKASQQAAWEDFSQSIELLSEQSVKNPGEEADAASIARFHADRAADISKKLAKIAEATAKLQSVLTEDQRKVLNQTSRNFLHHEHGWNKKQNCQNHDGHD